MPTSCSPGSSWGQVVYELDEVLPGEALVKKEGRIPKGWRTKALLLLLSGLLCVVTAEVAVRAFWRISHQVPLRDPGRILYAYYPELSRVDATQPAHGDEFYDILMLGASVLDNNWGTVESELLTQLADADYRKVRIFNLSVEAHTSRDSWLKYAALGDAGFELVIFYHGINEARANNVPPEMFRDNYSHYSWYEIVNTLAPYHRRSFLALPYTLHYLALRMRQALTQDRYVPTHSPRAEWVHFGQQSRSAVAFEGNLSAILNRASRRGDRVLLMTFAIHVPEDYSLEAFKNKRLDYFLHFFPIEIWGDREHVLATVVSHNEIVRRLANQHEDVMLVDQASLMEGSGHYFNDPCHFTPSGASQFVGHLLAALLRSDWLGREMRREKP